MPKDEKKLPHCTVTTFPHQIRTDPIGSVFCLSSREGGFEGAEAEKTLRKIAKIFH